MENMVHALVRFTNQNVRFYDGISGDTITDIIQDVEDNFLVNDENFEIVSVHSHFDDLETALFLYEDF